MYILSKTFCNKAPRVGKHRNINMVRKIKIIYSHHLSRGEECARLCACGCVQGNMTENKEHIYIV